MEKRGQVTIFIIIAVVVIAGIVAFLVMRNPSVQNVSFAGNPEGVKSFVQKCLEDNTNVSIYDIALSEGVYNKEIKLNSINLPYYFYEGVEYIPSKETIQNDISNLIDERTIKCINNFKNFRDAEITSGKLEIKTTISDENVLVQTEYPITIKSNGETIEMEKNFKDINIPIRLGTAYNGAKSITEGSLDLGEEAVCLSCVNTVANSSNFSFKIEYVENEGFIYTMTDKNTGEAILLFAGK